MLYEPEAFDSLTDRVWDEGWVRSEIERIVADADSAYDPEELWPAEEWDSWQTPTPLKALYVGAAGVVWALAALERRGQAQSRLDLSQVARRVHEAWRAEPDYMRGIELPSPARAGFLCRRGGHPHRRLAAGTGRRARGHALRAGHRERRERRQRDHVGLAGHDAGRARDARVDGRRAVGERVAGERRRAPAAARGRRALDDPPLRRDVSRPRTALTASSATSSRCASGSRTQRERRWNGTRRQRWHARPLSRTGSPTGVRHCSGVRELLGSSSRRPTTWTRSCCLRLQSSSGRRDRTATRRAMASATARPGNGYALLKTFERTGDERWLQRARRFAVHALEQAERLAANARATALFAVDGRRRSRALRRRLPGCDSARYPILDGDVSTAIEFRPMVADDLRLLHEWLRRPHALRWYGDHGTYEDVVAHYLPAIEGRDPDRSLHRRARRSGRRHGPDVHRRRLPRLRQRSIGIADSRHGRNRHRHRRGGAHRQGAGDRDPPPVRRRGRLRPAGDDAPASPIPTSATSRRSVHSRKRAFMWSGRSSTRTTGSRTRSCAGTAKGPRERRDRPQGLPAASVRESVGSADAARPLPARRP